MSESTERAAIAFEVSNFIALYWEDGEKNNAKDMADFISEDSVYDAKVLRLEGRKQICEFTQKRSAAVSSVGRHLMSNLYFDFSGWAERQEVTVRGAMTWYGGVGTGILPVSLPMSIYDINFKIRKGGKFGWTVVHTLYDPIFVRQDDDMKKYMGEKK